MIAMGLALGTGLFLGSGSAIKIAGPGAIIAYAVGSMIAAIIAACAGEMAVRHPFPAGSAPSQPDTSAPTPGISVVGRIGQPLCR